jgi:Helix-turn-helix of DDE superfamily endonuclease
MEQDFCIWTSFDGERLRKARRLKNELFRRSYGVKRRIFVHMVKALSKAYGQRTGRPPTLNLGEQVLFALEFWRHYPTYEMHSLRWGLSTRAGWQTIDRVETRLLSLSGFHLPGKRTLATGPRRRLVVDGTETPIQRPKKNRNAFTAEKRSATPSRRRSLSTPIPTTLSPSTTPREPRMILPSLNEAVCVFTLHTNSCLTAVIRGLSVSTLRRRSQRKRRKKNL